MTHMLPLLVFSDLDGTLLDHATYDWTAARPALEAIRSIGGGVVLATSKTAAEVVKLREQMGLDHWPAIVENGAGILPANALPDTENSDHAHILSCLAGLPAGFYGFSEMSDQEVANITGLALQDAKLARQRCFSEPGIWKGTEDELENFVRLAENAGIASRRGGRFLTLSLGQTKADRMSEITTTLKPRHTASLGDAPNDIEMLIAADYGFLIKNPHAPDMTGLPGKIRKPDLIGPAGWNAAILSLLQELELNGDNNSHG